MTDINTNINNSREENEKKVYHDLDLDSFDDHLCEYHNGDLLCGIKGYGFERPSPIQAKSIAPMCDKRDLIAQAQAGSGKTGAYVIPTLALVNPYKKHTQIVIIGNTRLLARQIHRVLSEIGSKLIEKHCLKVMLCVGGDTENNREDIRSSIDNARSSHILIGTPGKIIALMESDKRSKVKLLDKISLLILDEADALLSDEFAPQIQKIMLRIPKESQICLFSATYPKAVIELSDQFLNDPVRILVEKEEISVETIKNFFVNVERENNKYDNLVDIYQKISVCQAVIFVNSIKKAIELSDNLTKYGHEVGVLHSELDEKDKNDILKNFRLTRTRVLIATDLISRGIDVQQVGLVINYDVPYDSDKYIHRVGRSGRFGKLGVAITFMTCSRNDIQRMEGIERDYGIDFQELKSSKDLALINTYLTGMKGFGK